MIEVGRAAPDFTLRDQNNETVSLASFRGERAVLIVFYPFAFTGICTGELTRVRDDLDSFQNERVQVLTVSCDSPYAHKIFAEREGFTFPLLADFWPHGAVARAYETFNETGGMANRGTYLVDTGGIVRFAEVNGPGEGRDAGAWLAAIAALGD